MVVEASASGTLTAKLMPTDYVPPPCPRRENDAELIAQLRDELPDDLTDVERAFFDDASIHRYLRARKFNIAKSKDMLLATLKWRRETKPHLITKDDVGEEALTGKAYINGHDRQGRPIIILTPGRENTSTYERQLLFVIYLFEKAVNLMPEGVEQLIVMIDFNQFSLLKSPPLSVSRSFLDVLSNHYPERLYAGMPINPPFIFWGFWRIITPIIDPVTAQKIKFISTSSKNDVAHMGQMCDPEHLEKRLGGQFEFEYQYETYWNDLGLVPHRIAF